jgi:hypothetical protein
MERKRHDSTLARPEEPGQRLNNGQGGTPVTGIEVLGSTPPRLWRNFVEGFYGEVALVRAVGISCSKTKVLGRQSGLTTWALSGSFLTCCLLLFAVVVAPTSSRWVSDRTVIEGIRRVHFPFHHHPLMIL